jgi:methyl-accepting chemotaxis protein
VVAEEVRSLASRSAEAVKETTTLIEASFREVENGVKSAEDTAAVLSEISKSA